VLSGRNSQLFAERAMERQRKMQYAPQNASVLPTELQPDSLRTRPTAMEETVYKVVTVGAILLVLGSLWAF
jgi:hypothetical protein